MAEVFEPGVFYHVLNRGNNRENIFIERKNYDFFLGLVSKYLLQVCEIYCYCLLKNHFHFLLKIKDTENLPHDFTNGKKHIHQPFSNMFNAYTKAINKAYNRTGSLFQEHLHKIRITDNAYLRQLVAYIHLNPVKHRFVKDFKKYEYSSYQHLFAGNSLIINQQELIGFFDDIENFNYWHDLNKIRIDGNLKEIDKIDV